MTPLAGRVLLAALLALAASATLAHGVAGSDQAFIEATSGTRIAAFVYLGAKHMVTGYDHLLFLAGVVFFLYRPKDVALYVTLFALGHSVTLLYGVLGDVHVSPRLVDAIIGLSIVYLALDNLGAFRRLGWAIDLRLVVLGFGLCHGFGLAAKLQELSISRDGLVPNLLAFNAGIELGQLLALGIILIGISLWRRSTTFERNAALTNTLLLSAGFVLAGYQLAGYLVTSAIG